MMMVQVDTGFHFTPFSQKQLQVLTWWRHSKTRNLKVIICDGSVRAGKTVIMSLSFVFWSMTLFNGQQFGMAGKTIGSFRRNVFRPLKKMLIGRGYTVVEHRTDNMFEVRKGAVTNYFFYFGGKDEASQDLVQGITLNGFFFDEVALMPQSFVSQATARCSLTGSKLWFNMNPEGPYHWFKLEWIDDLEEKKALRIHFTMPDNPSLTPDILEDYKTRFSGIFYQRYILGLWVLAEGVVYSNWNQQTMTESPTDVHGYEEYYVSCDYGIQNPTVFLMFGRSGDTWHCCKMFYHSGRESEIEHDDAWYADRMDEFMDSIKAQIIIDPSASSFRKTLQNRGYTVRKAANDVLPGIRTTQRAMNNGKIVFADNLKELFAEFGSYIWDAKAAERGEDKVVKQHDHCCDALRYFVYLVIYKGTKAKIVRKPSWLRG
ncbi:PBSX family phage terminase large subunit [Loigolactobacillus coryniformis subsp. torquens]|nr:PBSX family phage terminase large subunit [Loigolactobacillus coryniformis]MBW4802889.1 PBSX family phage terminase large subunit [Loigolactobacillus coryniformis subsp. torquens]MBW4805579.1 PBSX family phage terminase large subunit [Loigolactobacillus coryniformis subsp. torquens]